MQSIYCLYCDAIWLTQVSDWFDTGESAICATSVVSKLKGWSYYMVLVVKNNELCGMLVKLVCCLLNGLFNLFLVSVHTWSVYCIDVFRPLKHGQHTMEQTYVPSGHHLSSELCKYNITVSFCICSEAPPDTRPGIWITHPHQVSPHRWYLMWVWSKPKWEIWKEWWRYHSINTHQCHQLSSSNLVGIYISLIEASVFFIRAGWSEKLLATMQCAAGNHWS